MGAADVFDPGEEGCQSGFLHTGLDLTNRAASARYGQIVLLAVTLIYQRTW